MNTLYRVGKSVGGLTLLCICLDLNLGSENPTSGDTEAVAKVEE